MWTYAPIVAVIAIATCCGLYLWIANRASKQIHSVEQYLPLSRFQNSRQYRGTTVAAGMSLATVMIALVNLAPSMGLALMVTVLTYSMSYGLLYPLIPRILAINPENRALPEFLGVKFGSVYVGRTAAIFTFLGYLSIFAMELLVGVTVVGPFFDRGLITFALLFFVFLVIYSWLSGYRGIVATDVWQLRFIVASILALFGYLVWNLVNFSTPVTDISSALLENWSAPLAFILGVSAMNLPAAISDTATWQRLCSTNSVAAARKGLRGAVSLFVVLWTALILIGALHSAVGDIEGLYGDGRSLMEALISGMASHRSAFAAVLLFIFMLGLFSAMVSTADSLLMAATHIVVSQIGNRGASPGASLPGLVQTRRTMVAIAVCSFVVFAIFHAAGLNVVQLVFAIYGAQLSLFPTTFAALTLSDRRLSIRTSWILSSIALGFVSAWVCAIAGQFSSYTSLQFYAPLVALLVASVVLGVGLVIRILSTEEIRGESD